MIKLHKVMFKQNIACEHDFQPNDQSVIYLVFAVFLTTEKNYVAFLAHKIVSFCKVTFVKLLYNPPVYLSHRYNFTLSCS